MSEDTQVYGEGAAARLNRRQSARIADAIAFGEQAPAGFLAAWKLAVKLAGERFFDVTAASVDQADDKNQLRPNHAAIHDEFGAKSHGEQIFLANLYCFFNSTEGQKLIDRLPDEKQAVDQFRVLDHDRRGVLCDLLRYDGGW